jgi:hypothetical protein
MGRLKVSSDLPIKFCLDNPNYARVVSNKEGKVYFIKHSMCSKSNWWRSGLIDEFKNLTDPWIDKRHYTMNAIIEAGLPFIMPRAWFMKEENGNLTLDFDNGHHRTAFLYTRGLKEFPAFFYFNSYSYNDLYQMESRGLIREATKAEMDEILSNTEALEASYGAISKIERDSSSRQCAKSTITDTREHLGDSLKATQKALEAIGASRGRSKG